MDIQCQAETGHGVTQISNGDSRNAAALIGALLFDGLLALAYVGAVDAFETKQKGGREDGC